jgi:hypothetical protein
LLQLLLLLQNLFLLLLLLPGLHCCSCSPSLASCLLLLLLFAVPSSPSPPVPSPPPAAIPLLILLLPRLWKVFVGALRGTSSEGPLISDQLRRGLLLVLRYFSTYCDLLRLAHHRPSRRPLTVEQQVAAFVDNSSRTPLTTSKSLSHTA